MTDDEETGATGADDEPSSTESVASQEQSQRKDQAIRDVVKGAGVVYGGLILEIVVAFLAQWLAARYLSVSGFGGVTTGVALLNIGAIVGSLGLGDGLTRYYPRYDVAKQAAITRGAFLFAVPTAIVLGGLVTFNAGFIATDVFNDAAVEPSIRIFGAVIPFAATLRLSVGGIRGQKQSRYRVYVENVVRPMLRFGLVVIAVVYGLGQAGFATAYAVPYVLGSLFAIVLLLRSLPETLHSRSIELPLTRTVLRYSLPFILSGAAGFVYRSADIFLLLFFRGSTAVGTYGVAYAVARLMLLFSTAFNFIGAPVSSELEAGEGIGEAISVQRSILRWLAIASVPVLVPFVFFPADFIATVYRPRYVDGAVALAVLTVAFGMHNVFSAQGNILQALGRSRLIAANPAVSATVNVGLNLVLIPRFGIEGAAVATAVSYLVMDGVLSAEVSYLTDDTLVSRSVLAPVLLAVPLLGATGYISQFVPGTLIWIVVVSAAFGLTYLTTIVLVIGIRPEEEMLVKSVGERYGISLWPLTPIVERFRR